MTKIAKSILGSYLLTLLIYFTLVKYINLKSGFTIHLNEPKIHVISKQQPEIKKRKLMITHLRKVMVITN